MTLERAVIDDERADSIDSVEDVARYRFASRFVSGCNVLDVACGSGYGSRLLLEGGASSVIGADVSSEIIPHVRERVSSGAKFVIVPVNLLPFRDASFDVVVSLETLEHVRYPITFLSELRRVLIPRGVLVISTPLNNSDGRFRPSNPHHVREYSGSEFREIIQEFFRTFEIYSQVTQFAYDPICGFERTSLGSCLHRMGSQVLPLSVRRGVRYLLGSKGWHRTGSEIVSSKDGYGGYQVAVCR